MGKRIAIGLVSLALLPLVLTTACTAAPASPEAPVSSDTQKARAAETESIAPRSTEKTKPIWTKKLEPIGQPVLQDGVALVISGEGQLMELVALNVKNGKELWRKDYHPGHVPGGLPAVPKISEDGHGLALAILLQPRKDSHRRCWNISVDRSPCRGSENGKNGSSREDLGPSGDPPPSL